MTERRVEQRRRVYALVTIVVLVFLVLSILLYRIVNDAVRTEVTGQTRAAASTAAVAVANAIREDTRLAVAIVGEGGTAGLVQRNASRADSYAVQYANINIQRANPQVTALYYYDNAGTFVVGQRINASRRPPNKLSVSCDATNTYCTDGNGPGTGYLRGAGAKVRLAALLRGHATTAIALAFGRDLGPFGALFIAQPIPAANARGFIGLLVMQIDASTVFSPYLAEMEQRNLIVDGPVIIGRDMPAYYRLGQLPVSGAGARLDPLLSGGFAPAPLGFMHRNNGSQISLDGADLVGSKASVGVADLSVISYTNANALTSARSSLILAATPLVLLMILSVVGPVYYESRRARKQEHERAELIKVRSDNLVRDIMVVARSLESARGGAAAESAEGRSEVDRLSHSLSGLLGKYSEIARGVSRASHAIEETATRFEQGMGAALAAAAAYRGQLDSGTAQTRRVAEGVAVLRQSIKSADLADQAVRDALVAGKDAGSQLPASFDLMKAALVGFSQEFDRLKDYSNRLSAATAAVKTLAENVQAHATYALNAAGYATGSTGETAANNLGRLARQAKSTLADVEASGRGVNSTISAMGHQLEQIWEQFRDSLVKEQKSGASFDGLIEAYGKLVDAFGVLSAGATALEAGAPEAATSLDTISERFRALETSFKATQGEAGQLKRMSGALRTSANELEMQEIRLHA